MMFFAISGILRVCGASLVSQLVKNPPAMQETWVRSLGWEDPLKKGKATHSSILSSPVATAEFSKFAGILSAALSQHHLSGFETASYTQTFLLTSPQSSHRIFYHP